MLAAKQEMRLMALFLMLFDVFISIICHQILELKSLNPSFLLFLSLLLPLHTFFPPCKL